ncbi:MAG: CHAD domain-containing protein [Anaerolineales bacterium]
MSLSEKEQLARIIELETNEALLRRARILILHDQGLSTDEIGDHVNLSPRTVRYWLNEYRQKGMDIFPQAVLENISAAPVEDPTEPVVVENIRKTPPDEFGSDAAIEPGEVTGRETEAVPSRTEPSTAQSDSDAEYRWENVSAVEQHGSSIESAEADVVQYSLEELCDTYQIDMNHAGYVALLAVDLFDRLEEFHELEEEYRRLTKTAAIVHDVGHSANPESPHTFGRDLLLDLKLIGVQESELRFIAFSTAMGQKEVKQKRLNSEYKLASIKEHERFQAGIIAALVRIADGLDASMSQSTAITDVTYGPDLEVTIRVEGPAALDDSLHARENADLLSALLHMPILVIAESQLVDDQIVEPPPPAKPSLPKKIKKPGILRDDPMSEAGRKTFLFHFVRMLANEDGTREGSDIEELHDMRVATRRMRSAMRVFRPYYQKKAIRPFLKGLRQTGRALGSVRDLDVFMENAASYLQTLPPEDQTSLDPLLSSWEVQREAARAKMLTHLDSNNYNRFVSGFGEFLTTEGAGAILPKPSKPTADRVFQIIPVLIYHHLEVVLAYENVLEGASLETHHALRIDMKRFRYILEFFQEVLGGEVKPVIADAVAIQDHLGALNDADVACQILIEYLDNWREKDQRERINIQGVTQYLIAQQTTLRTLVDTFPEQWEHFTRKEMRRELGLAVANL